MFSKSMYLSCTLVMSYELTLGGNLRGQAALWHEQMGRILNETNFMASHSSKIDPDLQYNIPSR